MSQSSDMKLEYGVKTVTAAGTPEKLATGRQETVRVSALIIRALTGNGGDVYIGEEDVDSSTPDNCYILAPGETISWAVEAREWEAGVSINISKIFVDVDTSGEGVCYTIVRE